MNRWFGVLLVALVRPWMAIGAYHAYHRNLQYELDALQWYDPVQCYVIDGPTLFSPASPNLTQSRPGSRDHWREHAETPRCPAASLQPTNRTSECGKLLLRRSVLPLVMTSLDAISANVDDMWKPVYSANQWDWVHDPRDQFQDMRIRNVENDIKILWDILAYRLSNGTTGAELTSRHSWRQLLQVPVVSDVSAFSPIMWYLHVLVNRLSNHLIPMSERQNKASAARSGELTSDAHSITNTVPDISKDLHETVKGYRMLTHFFTHNKKKWKSHRSYYLKLRKKVRVLRRLRKVTKRIKKKRREAEEKLFIVTRPYNKIRSWDDKSIYYNITVERLRYRVTLGDAKSNVLDMQDQVVWLGRDARRAQQILDRITPRLRQVMGMVSDLEKMSYEDYLIYNIQAIMSVARAQYAVIPALYGSLIRNMSDLAVRCAYLDVIQTPVRYEKARVDVALAGILRDATFAVRKVEGMLNASRPYVALSSFMTIRYDDCKCTAEEVYSRYDQCICAPIERDLSDVQRILKRAANILRNAASRPSLTRAALEGEGFLPADEPQIHPGRRLLWFWKESPEPKNTTVPSKSVTEITTQQPSTETTETLTRSTKPPKTKRPKTAAPVPLTESVTQSTKPPKKKKVPTATLR